MQETCSSTERAKVWNACVEHPERMFENAIIIKDKNEQLVPFRLNSAQIRVMDEINRQLKETGRVRLAILKSRQMGISTLCHAVMLWRMMAKPKSNVMLMANRQTDMETIHFKGFKEMAKGLGERLLFPITNDTTKSLDFFLSTAVGRWANTGSGERGGMLSAVHLTEIDYYNDLDECMASVIQKVPHEDGTFVLIESTSKGLDGNMHRLFKRNAGYKFLFLPWYEQVEYAIEGDPVALTEEQQRIKAQYKLTDAQMNWYALKEKELGSHLLMQHEYPCCIEDCFAYNDDETYVFDVVSIEKAVKQKPAENRGARLVLGIDPARINDRVAMVWRRGRNVEKIVSFQPPKCNDRQTADDLLWERVAREIREKRPDDIFVDVGGIGGNVPYILRSLGIDTYIHEVYFNQSPDNKSAYHDKRAEMYARARDWLHDGAYIPNDDDFARELRMIKFIPEAPKFQLVEKSEIKKNLKHSPDLADAFALTFPYKDYGAVSSNNIRQFCAHLDDKGEFSVSSSNRQYPNASRGDYGGYF